MLKQKKRKPTPGPGRYSIKEDQYQHTVRPRVKALKFLKTTKDINYDNKIPGVGKYCTTDSSRDFGKSAKGKFTMSQTKRECIVDMSKTSSSARRKGDITALEPGKYNVPADFGSSGRRVLLRGKPKPYERSKTPGPGSYKYEEAK